MSKYTTELRFIIDNYADRDNVSINERIEKAIPHIFNFTYDIDTQYKKILEHNILKHFYRREIGFETVDLWLFKLETKMQLIMPYYNELYKTLALEYNPLYNYEMKEEVKRKTEGETEAESTGSLNNKNINRGFDTPDGEVNPDNLSGSITNLTDSSNDTNSNDNSKSKINNLEDYVRNIVGVTGISKSTLLKEFRSAIINIDAMIIKDLSTLFMGVY